MTRFRNCAIREPVLRSAWCVRRLGGQDHFAVAYPGSLSSHPVQRRHILPNCNPRATCKSSFGTSLTTYESSPSSTVCPRTRTRTVLGSMT